MLEAIDRKGYPAYKGVKGEYQFPGYILSIDHVQGDPFASPSKVSILIGGRAAGFPPALFDAPEKRIAVQDYLLRLFSAQIEKYNFKAKGSGKSGLIGISRCGQEILERSAFSIAPGDGSIKVCFEVGFPANGRTINSGELIKIFFEFLPVCVKKSLFYSSLDKSQIESVVELAQDQQYIRSYLREHGLAAFVADGAVLPRQTGVSDKPMKGAVPFRTPDSLKTELVLPHRGRITGMGIPKGITLIVGGGYHGKSTVLKALELGVYNHVAGDGREYVITDDSAVKLRAEDSRSISRVDISLFINHLPNKKDTLKFETQDASGSTSQAANAAEAIEAGSRLFLIDEDTSATNFMVRDELMQRVVSRDKEPITPFVERVRGLYERCGVSSIIVAGSSGTYFHVADTVLQMENYMAYDITDRAKEAARDFTAVSVPEEIPPLPDYSRCPKADGRLLKNDRIKVRVFGKDSVSIDKETVDLRYVEQLADSEQSAALVYFLKYALLHLMDGKRSMIQIVDALEETLQKKGFQAFTGAGYEAMGLCVPRRQEIFACLNRYRGLKF